MDIVDRLLEDRYEEETQRVMDMYSDPVEDPNLYDQYDTEAGYR